MTKTPPIKLGPTPEKKGVRFAVRSETAERVWVSIFNKKGDDEIARFDLARDGTVFSGLVPKLKTFFVGKDFVVVGMTRIPVVVQQVDRGVLVAVRTGVGLCGQTASTTSSS